MHRMIYEIISVVLGMDDQLLIVYVKMYSCELLRT